MMRVASSTASVACQRALGRSVSSSSETRTSPSSVVMWSFISVLPDREREALSVVERDGDLVAVGDVDGLDGGLLRAHQSLVHVESGYEIERYVALGRCIRCRHGLSLLCGGCCGGADQLQQRAPGGARAADDQAA